MRIECLIEGSTSPGNVQAVIDNVNAIVNETTFYIPGTNASSGKLSYFMGEYWCLQSRTSLTNKGGIVLFKFAQLILT